METEKKVWSLPEELEEFVDACAMDRIITVLNNLKEEIAHHWDFDGSIETPDTVIDRIIHELQKDA